MGTQKLIVVGTTNAERTHKIIDTTGLADADLSWKAKGMHAYIRTHGDSWLKNQEALVGASTDGRDAVRAGIAELVERKYLHRTTVRNDMGQISYHLYISVPMPMEFNDEQIIAIARGEEAPAPQPGLPAPGNPLQVRLYSNSYYPSGNNDYETNKFNNPSGYQTVLGTAQGRTVQNIMDFWNSLSNLPTHKQANPPTKTHHLNVKALTKILKHHSPMVLKDAMKAYDDLLVAPYTTLGNVSKRTPPIRVSLYEFFEFRYKSREIVAKQGHPLYKVHSWFNECRQGPDHLIERFAALRKDKYPKITARLTTMWDVLVGIDNSAKEKNAIRLAAERLKDFIDLNKPRFHDFRLAVVPAIVDRLEQLLTSKLTDANLHTGWLVSDITWAELEKYLVGQNIIKERYKPERRAKM